MRVIRNEIKHIMRTVTILATLFTMTFVLAGSASADEIGPLGNSVGLESAILNQPVSSGVFVRPPLVSPFFRPNPFVNPFFRPPIFNPFLGADLDDLGLGFGLGIGAGLGIGEVD